MSSAALHSGGQQCKNPCDWFVHLTSIMFPNWNHTLIAVSASFHSVAIVCTVFRLWYRLHIRRMWWDDAWAALALLADVACLVVTALEQPITSEGLPSFFEVGNWVFSFAYPVLIWATRISILVAIIRVSRPEGMVRRVALAIGIFFGLAGITMFAMRLSLCIESMCLMSRALLVTQITVDCTADILLSALPIWFLRGMKLSQKRKILVCSALSAAMVINIISVVEAVMLLGSTLTSGSIIFEHVKLACSLIVCNLLVIVAFAFGILRKRNIDTEGAIPNKLELTTVDLAQVEFSQEMSGGRLSLSATPKSSWSYQGNHPEFPKHTAVARSRVDAERVEGC